MADASSVHQHINDLVAEEHALRERLAKGEITVDEEHARLNELERELDQLWDLLRRRRAAKKAGTSPDEVESRSVDEVEHYLQ